MTQLHFQPRVVTVVVVAMLLGPGKSIGQVHGNKALGKLDAVMGQYAISVIYWYQSEKGLQLTYGI